MENVIAAAQAIYTDEQRMLLENFRKMAEAEFAPLAEKYEDLGHPPDADTLKSLFAKVEEFGLISGLIPEEDGGAGIDRMTYGILYEELARIWADLAIAVLIQSHAVFAVNLLGDAAGSRLERARGQDPRGTQGGQDFCYGPKALDFQRGAIGLRNRGL